MASERSPSRTTWVAFGKGATQSEIVRSIEAVAAGEAIFGPVSRAGCWVCSPRPHPRLSRT